MTQQPASRGTLRRAWRAIRPLLWNPPRWRAALRRNLLLKLLSVVAAFSLWLFVNAGARETEMAVQVPLELRNIPSHLMVVSPRVDSVDFIVAGPRTILGRIDRDRLIVPLDLTRVRPGPAVFRIGAESINLPRGVKISRINPSQVTLELARIGRKTVPVSLEIQEDPPQDLVIGETTVTPRSVEVSGPFSDVRSIESVHTEPVPLEGAEPGPRHLIVLLEPPGEYFSLAVSTVEVDIRLDDKIVAREYARPVEVRNAAYRYSLEPTEVHLSLRGPKRILDALELQNGAVYIDAANEEPGVHLLTPHIDLPAGVDVASETPATFRLQLLASETPTPEPKGTEP